MAGKLNITACVGVDEGSGVSIYVSVMDDSGAVITGLAKSHFKLNLLHPSPEPQQQKFFSFTLDSVKDLDNGNYKVLCGNSGSGFLPGSRIILSLRVKKGGFGSPAGQTLVAFEL